MIFVVTRATSFVAEAPRDMFSQRIGKFQAKLDLVACRTFSQAAEPRISQSKFKPAPETCAQRVVDMRVFTASGV